MSWPTASRVMRAGIVMPGAVSYQQENVTPDSIAQEDKSPQHRQNITVHKVNVMLVVWEFLTDSTIIEIVLMFAPLFYHIATYKELARSLVSSMYLYKVNYIYISHYCIPNVLFT